MKRAVACFFFASVTFAQQGRDGYRDAFQAWRATDAALEREAATADATLGARADKVAAAAASYLGAKKTYADTRAAAVANAAPSIEAVTLRQNTPAQDKNVDVYLSVQNASVTASIGVFGDDPDRGIQQLRQTMERERTALVALEGALRESRAASAAAFDASEKAEQERVKFTALLTSFAASFQQTAGVIGQQATAWPAYYRALAETASAAGPAAPPPATQIGSVRPAIPDASSPAAAAIPTTVAGPSDAAPARTAPPVPLSRYTGAWTYTRSGAMFFGAEPDIVDMVVREDKGEISGTLYARFKLPAGARGDPLIRFEFNGALKPSRNQSFALVTSDRAMGTIQLIPGPAFNLLEVNFKADPAAGKIRQANFILLKK